MCCLDDLSFCRVNCLNQLFFVFKLLSVLVWEVKLLFLIISDDFDVFHKLRIAGHESVQNSQNVGVGLHLRIWHDSSGLELEPVQNLLN